MEVLEWRPWRKLFEIKITSSAHFSNKFAESLKEKSHTKNNHMKHNINGSSMLSINVHQYNICWLIDYLTFSSSCMHHPPTKATLFTCYVSGFSINLLSTTSIVFPLLTSVATQIGKISMQLISAFAVVAYYSPSVGASPRKNRPHYFKTG